MIRTRRAHLHLILALLATTVLVLTCSVRTAAATEPYQGLEVEHPYIDNTYIDGPETSIINWQGDQSDMYVRINSIVGPFTASAVVDGLPVPITGGRGTYYSQLPILQSGEHTITISATSDSGVTASTTVRFQYQLMDIMLLPQLEHVDAPSTPQRTCVPIATTWRDTQTRVSSLVVKDPATQELLTYWDSLDSWKPGMPDPGATISYDACPTHGSGTYHYSFVAWNWYQADTKEIAVTFDVDAPVIGDGIVNDRHVLNDGERFPTDAPTTIRWRVSDADSGLDLARVMLDDVVVDAESARVTVDATLRIPLGAHELAIEAVDAAGNTTRSTKIIVGVEPLPAPSPAAVTGGGQASASASSTAHRVATNHPARMSLRLVQDTAGSLQRTNMLTLRVRASEWSVWRIKIGGTTFLRRALVRNRWRLLRINLGDRTPIGRKLNAARPGAFVRIPIELRGTDAKQLIGRPTKLVIVARA